MSLATPAVGLREVPETVFLHADEDAEEND